VTTPKSPGGGGIAFLQLGIQGGTTGAIADLLSLAGDVEYARWCAQTYLQWMSTGGPQGPEADNLRRAIWTAACISYRRVFTSGKGHLNPQTPRQRPNDNFTAALTSEQLAVHNSVLETANRHVAHRVNELEQVIISALLNPPPLPRAISNIATMMLHYLGPKDAEEVEHFIAVCDLLLAGTRHEYGRLSDQALEDLRQRDLDEMYAAAEAQAQSSTEQGNT